MKYSIIIPVYNVEKYLKQSIQSVLDQTYEDFEVILIDDGSTDNCPAICDELAEKDERVKVIHKQNGGVSSARNEGILQAKGDYILFLDADDCFDKKLLENCLPYTEKELNAFYFNYANIYKNGEQVVKPNFNNMVLNLYDEQWVENFKKLLWGNRVFIGVIWNGCYNRSFILKNNLFFDTRYVLSEDSLYNIILFLYIDKYLVLDFVGYYYNCTNENSVCKTKSSSLDNFVHMCYDTYENLKNRNVKLEKKDIDFILYYIITFGNGWIARVENTKDVKKYYSKFKITEYKDFYKSFMKTALKNAPKIIYNEFRPHIYIKEKCYRALNIYSINQNKFALKLRCFFIDFTFPFVRLNAKIKRRLKGLLKGLFKK